MTLKELQTDLTRLGFYKGRIDGVWGPGTRAAVLASLTDGPDTPLTEADVSRAALRIGCSKAAVWAVYDVEASGDPFINGRPTILFEPHRFSKMTKGRYDRSHPNISYPKWGARPYPRTQTERYNQLLDAMALDLDAALMAASWGGFQVLGENYKSLGYKSAWDFAWQQSRSVGDQLNAFIAFVIHNGLDRHLRSLNWAAFARGYNGTGFRKNQYDTKLANRFSFRQAA